MEHIRPTYIRSVWQIFAWLWFIGVPSIGVEIFPLFSLKTFTLLKLWKEKILAFPQSPNCVSSKEIPAQQAHNVSTAFVEQCCCSLSTLVRNYPSSRCPRLPNKPVRVLSEHLSDIKFRHQNCLKQTKLFNKTRSAKSMCSQKTFTNTRTYLVKNSVICSNSLHTPSTPRPRHFN